MIEPDKNLFDEVLELKRKTMLIELTVDYLRQVSEAADEANLGYKQMSKLVNVPQNYFFILARSSVAISSIFWLSLRMNS